MPMLSSERAHLDNTFDGRHLAMTTETSQRGAAINLCARRERFRAFLFVQVETPIVFAAAMRRPDQPSTDGPANLLAASFVAISPSSRGKGILVVADDEIHAGPLIRKVHSIRPHAFGAILVNGVLDEARAAGLPARLAVFASNALAQRFYLRLGFKPIKCSGIGIRLEWREPCHPEAKA
jgi:GNAT superfamily N-acetyltransferase